MSDWRPMDTAPKPTMGDVPIIVDLGNRVDVAFWDDHVDKPGWHSATNHDECYYEPLAPLGWQPMPAPSAQQTS